MGVLDKTFYKVTLRQKSSAKDDVHIIGGHFPSVNTPADYEKKLEDLIRVTGLTTNLPGLCLFGDLQGRWVIDKTLENELHDVWYDKTLKQYWDGKLCLIDRRSHEKDMEKYLTPFENSQYDVKKVDENVSLDDDTQKELKLLSTYKFHHSKEFSIFEKGATRAGNCDFAFYNEKFAFKINVKHIQLTKELREKHKFLSKADHTPIWFKYEDIYVVSMNLGGIEFNNINASTLISAGVSASKAALDTGKVVLSTSKAALGIYP